MRQIALCPLALLFASAAAGLDDNPPPAHDVPVVESREDFLSLSRPEKWRYSRANREPVSFFIEGGGLWSTSADLDDASGDVGVARLRAGGGLAFRVSDTADLIIRGNAQFSFYEFNDAAGVIPTMPAVSEPFDDVYSFTFNPVFRVLPEHGWQWFVGGRVRSAGEPGADFDDTLIAGGIAGASYSVTDTFRLGLAVTVDSRLEGGIWVFPIPIIDWDITKDITLRTLEDSIALEYWFANSWNVSLRIGYDRYEYRFADDNPIAGGSVTDIRVPVGLALTYSPSDRTIITGRIGSEMLGSLEFVDANENVITETDLGLNMFVGFDLRIAF